MRCLSLSRRNLYAVSLLTLLFPCFLFLLTWVRLWIAIPCILAFGGAFLFFLMEIEQRSLKSVFECQQDEWTIPLLSIFACLACATLWTFLSGIGGFFYQNDDFYGRNAIFHDLLEHQWPVRFDGTNYALTYYIGYWLLPALIGKICADFGGAAILWKAANLALFFETVWFLFLIFLLFLSVLNVHRLLPVCGFLLMFVLFSGMDGLVCFYWNDWTDQIEWWAQTWQYSSHTTCLFWVFNQAVPAWLATMLFISIPDMIEAYALIGLSILPCSPLPLVGIVILCVGIFIYKLAAVCRERNGSSAIEEIKRAFSPANILAVVASIPCFLYLRSNAASTNAPFRIDMYLHAYSLLKSVGRLVTFNLIEWAVYALIMLHVWKKNYVYVIVIASLFVIPIFRVGYNMDFSMRASIPGLLILSVYCARYLRDGLPRKRIGSMIIIIFLLIGSITPMLEFQRGTYRVYKAGTCFIYSDPFKTVLHPDADTDNFICRDINNSFFYKMIAK